MAANAAAKLEAAVAAVGLVDEAAAAVVAVVTGRAVQGSAVVEDSAAVADLAEGVWVPRAEEAETAEAEMDQVAAAALVLEAVKAVMAVRSEEVAAVGERVATALAAVVGYAATHLLL